MINNHFVDDSLFSVFADKESILAFRDSIIVFCEASGEIVRDHKIKYWLVGLEDRPMYFPGA